MKEIAPVCHKKWLCILEHLHKSPGRLDNYLEEKYVWDMKYRNFPCIGKSQSENGSKWVEYLRGQLYTCTHVFILPEADIFCQCKKSDIGLVRPFSDSVLCSCKVGREKKGRGTINQENCNKYCHLIRCVGGRKS